MGDYSSGVVTREELYVLVAAVLAMIFVYDVIFVFAIRLVSVSTRFCRTVKLASCWSLDAGDVRVSCFQQSRRAVVAHRRPLAGSAAAAPPRRQGLSQEAQAHVAGSPTYTYQKFERGGTRPGTPTNPCLRTLIALAIVLDVRVEELVDGIER